MGTSAVTETLSPVEEGQLRGASLERLWTLRDSVLVISLNGGKVARGHQDRRWRNSSLCSPSEEAESDECPSGKPVHEMTLPTFRVSLIQLNYSRKSFADMSRCLLPFDSQSRQD